MRAAEALILGSTILKPVRQSYDTGTGFGCALGMMNRAIGGDGAHHLWGMVFPWLGELIVESPASRGICSCGCGQPEAKRTVEDTIIHLWDNEGWTASQIAEWLAKIDPTPLEEPVTLPYTVEAYINV